MASKIVGNVVLDFDELCRIMDIEDYFQRFDAFEYFLKVSGYTI